MKQFYKYMQKIASEICEHSASATLVIPVYICSAYMWEYVAQRIK